MRALRSILSLVAVGPSLAPAFAQAPRQIRLKPPTAELKEEFTSVGSVRELSDARVLINDPSEGRVVLADLKTGIVQQVGRKGQGPGEYSMAGPIYAISPDSSLLADGLSRRWLLFSGPDIVATLPPLTPIITLTRGFIRGTDQRGNVWIIAPSHPFVQEKAQAGSIDFGPADSDFVVRANRATGRADTIAKVRLPVSRQIVRTNEQGKFSGVSWPRAPLSVGEEAALFPDGWLAIARLDPYRVDWISPEGRVNQGRPIPVVPIKVTSAEKEAYHARQAAAQAGQTSRLPPAMLADANALRDQFPEEFPPFTVQGAMAGGDGNLWLRHPVSMNFPDARYDVVDRSGRLVGVVSLGKDERIVAVSKTAVYVAWKDADDIERLRRHPPIP